MRLRDHLLAAGLALAVMALSLTVGGNDVPADRVDDADVAAATNQP
jgi:hypothetical protein